MIELLVVIGIIGLLLSLTLPAVRLPKAPGHDATSISRPPLAYQPSS